MAHGYHCLSIRRCRCPAYVATAAALSAVVLALACSPLQQAQAQPFLTTRPTTAQALDVAKEQDDHRAGSTATISDGMLMDARRKADDNLETTSGGGRRESGGESGIPPTQTQWPRPPPELSELPLAPSGGGGGGDRADSLRSSRSNGSLSLAEGTTGAAATADDTDDKTINSGAEDNNEAVAGLELGAPLLLQRRRTRDLAEEAEPGFGGETRPIIGFHQKQEMDGGGAEGYGDMRVAVLLPYSGDGLPVWFDTFTHLAAANKEVIDWIVFCKEEMAQTKTPDNVIMIPTAPRQLAWMLAGVVYPAMADDFPEIFIEDYDKALEAELTPIQEGYVKARLQAAEFIERLILTVPYYLVEFKPALGWVFRNYLKGYSHWAFGDLDIFFGDMTKGWMEPQELRDFDIVTYSFGDQHRAYLRGQLTVQKISRKVDAIWRHCHHLSDYAYRIDQKRITNEFPLLFDEGCYSTALMFARDVKAKYAYRVFSDMSVNRESSVEVVVTGDGLVSRCPEARNRVGEEGGELAALTQMQVEVGNLVRVDRGPDRCENWVDERFQTCLRLALTSFHTNVYLDDGQFYQREFKDTWKGKVEKDCEMGAFYHFQNTKDNYRSWNTRPPMPPVHMGMVTNPTGVIPLPNGDWKAMAMDLNAPQPRNRDRFTHRYCMAWSVDTDDGSNPFSCVVTVTAEGSLTTLRDTRTEAAKRLGGEGAVTLGGVGGLTDLDGLLASMREWRGPKILVLVLCADDLDQVRDTMDGEESAEDSSAMKNALVAAFVLPREDDGSGNGSYSQEALGEEVPFKSLLNALHDLCQTRHLLTLSPGFQLGRGTEEAVSDALQTPAMIPRVLVIPQWCVDSLLPAEGLSSLDVKIVKGLAQEGTARVCHPLTVDPRRVNSLLRSDVLSPVVVVDLWSAPALFLRHVEEFTGRRCFEGAYARGLWAAGFTFEVLEDSIAYALKKDVTSTNFGCRAGSNTTAEAYSSFLTSVRRVYSDSSNVTSAQAFRIMSHGK